MLLFIGIVEDPECVDEDDDDEYVLEGCNILRRLILYSFSFALLFFHCISLLSFPSIVAVRYTVGNNISDVMVYKHGIFIINGTVPKMNLNAVCMLDTCFRVGFLYTPATPHSAVKRKKKLNMRKTINEIKDAVALQGYNHISQLTAHSIIEVRKSTAFSTFVFSVVYPFIFASKPQAIILKQQNESYVITKLHRNSREESVEKCID